MPASPTRTDGGSELFYDPMDRTMSGTASTIGGEPADCTAPNPCVRGLRCVSCTRHVAARM